MSMLDFAHHIIAVANENDKKITNLQLQKVMYFSLKDALKHNTFTKEQTEYIYDVPFEVWRYGPVVRKVYELYKPNGASPIVENEHEIDIFKPINKSILKYLDEDPFKLVKESHEEKFWINNEKYISGWRSLIKYGVNEVME